nr:hypothetical protein BaRGS_017878 [Batillaria attramentaria]
MRFYGPSRCERSSEIDRRFLHNFHPHYAQACDEDEKQRQQWEDQNRVSQDDAEKLETLTVNDLDLSIKGNAFMHNTLRYHCVQTKDNTPVFRRGQEFDMTLTFDRPYDKEKDDLHLIFEADEGCPAKNLQVEFTLDEDKKDDFDKDDDWGARIISRDGNALKIAVFIPGSCVVGEWELKVKTTLVGSMEDFVMIYPKPIAILFNPWSTADTVYMEDQNLLHEYILNEAGTVFTGTSDSIGSRSWTYGQFEGGILTICFHLLKKAFGFKMTPAMADPVEVSRALTRSVNSSDDDGLLAGNWSGDYSGGTSPMTWKTSTAILREYAKTVCRALGLPCRSVTNFDSAHDTDNTCTIDHYFDDEGNRLTSMGHDSVWNFHVWNEVWILRPDLPPGYDGWHCIDATPQEQSQGVFQCGPCPVTAVKKGEIHIGYDTAFVFSEVNAEVVHWVVEDGDIKNSSSVDREYVGCKLSTKVPDGKPTPNDKHLNYYTWDDSAELKVNFVKGEQTMVGQDFVSKVKVKNVSKENKRVVMTMAARESRYWDSPMTDGNMAKQKFDEITLTPDQEEEFQLKIPAEVYLKQCDDSLCFFTYACARDMGRNMPYSTQKPCRLRRPDLTVKGPEKALSGEMVSVDVSFTNPLPETPLTGCTFEMVGSFDVSEDDTRFDSFLFMNVMHHKDVKPGEEVKITVKLYRTMEEDEESPVTRTMDFSFNCKELSTLTGNYSTELSQRGGQQAAQQPAQQS